MFLIKRKNDNHYSYAYEPTDQVKVVNKHVLEADYTLDTICTVIAGRSRYLSRTNLLNQIYTIRGNQNDLYPLRVASWEITPAVKHTPEEYKELIAEWEKDQMVKLLLQGVKA